MEPFLRTVILLPQNKISVMLLLYGATGFVGTFLGEIACTRYGVRKAFLAMSLLTGTAVSSMTFFGKNIIISEQIAKLFSWRRI